MNKIQRVSYIFKLLFQFIFVVVLLIPIFGWIQAPMPFLFSFGWISVIPEAYQNLITYPLDANTKLLAFMVDMLPTIVELLVLYFLIKLFGLYEKGEIFSLKNVRYIRNVGYALLINELLRPVRQFLLGFILTWHNPPGQKIALMTISGTNVGIILTALIIILISWIMAEGYKLQEEQELTI